MSNSKNSYKARLTKILLITALFFSVFSFNGFSGNLLTKDNKITQTEVVISTISKAKKNTAYYKNFSAQLCEISQYTVSKEFIIEFDRLTQIQFTALSKQEHFPKILFLHNKLLPQNQTGDPANLSIIG